jgi:putative DNA methylase
VLLAIAADTETFGRVYVSPPEKLADLPLIQSTSVEETPLPKGGLGFRVQNYGLTSHCDLYTDRQLKTFSIFVDQCHEVLKEVKKHCSEALSSNSHEYERAIASYLGLTISKAARYWTTLSFWRNDDGKLSRAFGRQTVSMTWDFAETNPFADAGGDFLGLVEGTAAVIESLPMIKGEIWQHDARSKFSVNDVIIATDPPYYDNVGYADLSDFFYVWLRKCLRKYYPDLFSTILTPKSGELILDTDRHTSKSQAIDFFERGLLDAVSQMVPVSLKEFPSTMYYAYKQAENKERQNGEVAYASTGWASFLNSIVHSGLQITGTVPVHTEGKTRMRAMNSNALASSVVLACRNRPKGAPPITRATFLRELKDELPRSLKLLQAGSVAPVDLTQAAIGPGMAIFSRYNKVLNVDDTVRAGGRIRRLHTICDYLVRASGNGGWSLRDGRDIGDSARDCRRRRAGRWYYSIGRR